MPDVTGDRRLLCFISAALILVTGLVYLQVGGHEFLHYDDDEFLVDNPAVQQGLNAESIRWAFTTNHAYLWLPATWLSHMVDFELFGRNPGGHHLMNLALHLLCTVVLLWVLHRLTGRMWLSALVAALFALHPQHVESVAWVIERKDTLSTLFLFLTVGAYERYVRGGGRGAYLAALLLFAVGLMAKPMLVTGPVLLLILDLWPLGRDPQAWRRLLVEKVPFFLLAGVVSVVTFLVGRAGGIVAGLDHVPLWPRLANALVSAATYPRQMVWPFDLRVQYMFRVDLPWWQVVVATMFLAAVTVLAVRWRHARPWFAAGWAWYLVTLLPVSGVMQQGSHAMADRYTYVSTIGLFWIVAWGGAELLGYPARRRRVAAALAVLVLTGSSVLTFRQAALWRDGVTLFENALAQDPDDPVVLTFLGTHLASVGRTEEAVARYQEALTIQPYLPSAHIQLARHLAEAGEPAEAARHFRAALPGYPRVAGVHFDLGTQLMLAGDSQEAIASFRRALQLEPEHTGALTNLGLTLLSLERFDEAETALRKLVTVAPENPLAHYNLACGLSRGGDIAGAAVSLERALDLGFDNWDHLDSDPDLANLRAAPAFDRLRKRTGGS